MSIAEQGAAEQSAERILVQGTGVAVAIDGQQLLAAVDFELAGGRTMAISGPNGSGKTTLLQVVSGQRPASSGMVRVAGRSADERDAAFRAILAAGIGTPPMAHNLTLREQLALIAMSWGASAEAAREAAQALLAELDIAALEHRYPHELSSGQLQLFALSLVLIRPAGILLLDEPEQRLDAQRLGLVEQALHRRKDRGTTILFASHSAALIGSLADDVLTLEG